MAERNSPSETQNGSIDQSKLLADFAFRAPLEMRMKCEEAAAAAKLPLSTWLRNQVANSIGYQVQPGTARVGKLSEEERKARIEAQKQRDREQRALVKNLLTQHRKAGEAPAQTEQPATA